MAPAWSKKIKLNYLEQTVTAEQKKEAFYQMKEATRIEGPWTDEDKEIYTETIQNYQILSVATSSVRSSLLGQGRAVNFQLDLLGPSRYHPTNHMTADV